MGNLKQQGNQAMGKPTILRVVEGMVLPPEIETALKKLLDDYSLETYSQQPDNKKSTQARIDSLYKSFLFLVDAMPPSNIFSTRITVAAIKECATVSRAATMLNDHDSMAELQNKLAGFTKKLVDVIALNWFEKPNLSAVQEAIEYLNDAEQFLLMKEGRPNLATLCTFKRGDKTEYILQLDKSLTPYDNLLLQELKSIKERQFPKTRHWFRELSSYQKDYFCSWMNDPHFEPKDILQDLNSFITQWSLFKKDSLTLNSDLDSIKNGTQPIPDWYNKLSVRHQHLMKGLILKDLILEASCDVTEIDARLTQLKGIIIKKNDTPGIFKQELSHLHGIPTWYWVLSLHQQSLLRHLINKAETLEEVLSFGPSRIRFLPIVANYGTYNAFRITSEGAIPLSSDRFRSAHLASRNAQKFTREVQQRHVQSNLVTLTKDLKPGQPAVLQTLVSPIREVKTVDKVIPIPEKAKEKIPPDIGLYDLLESTIAQNFKDANLVTTNHPLNYYRMWAYTAADNPKSKLLIDKAQKLAPGNLELAELIDIYVKVLNSPRGTATYNDTIVRELFLSSLEHIIVLKIGGFSHGSCVSGKDRKGIELLHTSAMLVYKLLYGAWPKSYDDFKAEDGSKAARARFVDIFVGLYVTWHQHIHAGFNAPGSDGLKFPSQYLPKDISEAINKRIGADTTKNDDRRASNNEVKTISPELKKEPTEDSIFELKGLLMAIQLGEVNCTLIYDAICPIIGEKSLWRGEHTLFKGTPEGINDINNVAFNRKGSDLDSNVKRMGMIFSKMLKRPDKPGDRNDHTLMVYGDLKGFYDPKNQMSLAELVEKTTRDFKNLLDISKTSKAAAKATIKPLPPTLVREEPPSRLGKAF